MVYRKGYGYKRKYKPTYKTRVKKAFKTAHKVFPYTKSAWGYAKAAYTGYNMLAGIINSERKKYDTGVAFTNGAGQSVVGCLTDFQEGNTGVNDRDGISILAKSLSLRLHGDFDYAGYTSGGFTNQQMICYVVQDNQQVAGTLPTAAQMFNTTTSCQTLMNPTTVGRFKILKKCGPYTVTGVRFTVEIDCDIPLNHHIRYNGNTGTTDLQKGHIYLVWIFNQPHSNAVGALNGFSRLTYYDN